jgi:tRNA A-37 threonylcarbamoyl transferase component Bud32
VNRWLAGRSDLGECHVTGPLAVRQNSRLFQARCPQVDGALAVKICLRPHTDAVDSRAAQGQYETLGRVHRAMGGRAELSVPAPCLVIPEAGLVASEWVQGQTIAALLFSWRCSGTRARELVARAARWLRRFHACHTAVPGCLEVEEKLQFITGLQAGSGVRHPLFNEAVACLQDSAGAAAAVLLERSWVHGDFTADNLMIAGPRTLGIDVDVRFENSVIHDLAPFLNHLELRAFHPGGWPRALSLEDLGRTFVESYGSATGGAIALPLAWLRLCMLLQGWITARRNAASPLRARFTDLSFRTVAARLVRSLSPQAIARAS